MRSWKWHVADLAKAVASTPRTEGARRAREYSQARIEVTLATLRRLGGSATVIELADASGLTRQSVSNYCLALSEMRPPRVAIEGRGKPVRLLA